MSLFKNEDNQNRLTIKPIQNKDIYEFYKSNVAQFWTAEEITLNDDIKEWESGKISNEMKHFIKHILSFFASADILVANNISFNFVEEIEILEAQVYLRFQAMIEDVHSEVYSNLLEGLINDNEERNQVFDNISNLEVVKQKNDWAHKYSNRDNASFQERLIAFVIFEGVYFAASFCAIFYIKSKGLLPGLCLSNDFIARDESYHATFGCMMYKKLLQKLPESKVHKMFKTATEIESRFATDAIPVSMLGMNSALMTQYVQHVADYWLTQLKYSKLFNVENPFAFMNTIGVESKTNFFEKRASEYQKAKEYDEDDEDDSF